MRFSHPLYYRIHCTVFHDPKFSLTIRKYHCKICGLAVLGKDNIVKHAQAEHDGKGAYQCQFCKKVQTEIMNGRGLMFLKSFSFFPVLSATKLSRHAPHVRLLLQSRPDASQVRTLRQEILPAAKTQNSHAQSPQR